MKQEKREHRTQIHMIYGTTAVLLHAKSGQLIQLKISQFPMKVAMRLNFWITFDALLLYFKQL